MSKVVKALSTVAVGIATVATLSLPAHAVSGSAPKPHKHCMVILDKLHPGQRQSKVLAHKCASSEKELRPLANDRTLLMTWYEDADYNGDSTKVYGHGGKCDADGYGIGYVGGNWNDRISSFKTWNNCNYVEAFTNKNYGGHPDYYVGNTSYVGNAMNDKISSFLVHGS